MVTFAVLSVLCVVLLLSGLYNIQVKNGDYWRKRAKSAEEKEETMPARRGTIYSSDDKVLAVTMPVCDFCLNLGRRPKKDDKGRPVTKNGRPVMESAVYNDSAFLANLPKVCHILHEQFPHKSEDYYYNKIITAYHEGKVFCLYVERRVPYSIWASINALPGWEHCVVKMTSEGSVQSFVRAHIYGNLGENTIGLHYRTARQEGYTGLEGYYDSVLRGQDGVLLCRRMTRGSWLEQDVDSTTLRHRIDGKSIVATLDTRYQDIAESALRKSMNQFGGERGCAILMEVKTGYVLACANLKRDSLGQLSEQLWSNMAVSDYYDPGSTFKSVVMTSMLSDRKIDLDTSKRVRVGGVKSYSSTSRLISSEHGYATDTSSLPGVLAQSSNVGMCELAWQYYRNRREDFRKGIERVFPFGMLNPDLEVKQYATKAGSVKADRDFLNMSYGYSVTATPLQLITFYNAIANGGKMMKPLFCKEILDGSRHSVVEPVVLNEQMCSPEVAKQMKEMLVGVVEHGTADNIYTPVYGIAGKTGTAIDHHDHSLRNSSFAGFFPADNPKYTCLVFVAKTVVPGRVVAAPVFKQIADCVMAIDKDLGRVRFQDSGRVVNPVVTKALDAHLAKAYQLLGLPYSVVDSVHSKSGWVLFDGEKERYQNYVLPQGQVPDCTGMTVRDAISLLRKMGLKVKFSGQGKVAKQTPKARTPIKKGGTVVLELQP